MALLGRQAAVVVGVERDAGDPLRQAVEVDDEVGRFTRVGFAIRRLRPCCGRFGLGRGRRRRLVLLDRDFVALRREGMLHVLAQRHGEDARRPVGREIEFDRRDLRGELAVAQVEEVVPVRVPGGILGVELRVRDPADLAVFLAPDVDGAEAVRARSC